MRERGAYAPANPAAEWDPGVGAGRTVQEALRKEAVRLGVDVRPPVHQVDRGRDRDAGRQRPFADHGRLGQPSRDERDHRAEPQGLGDHRVEVGLLSRVDLLDQPTQLLRMASQPLHRPGQGGGGGLVARQKQRHKLVAKLPVGHGLTVFVTCEQQQGEDVRALVEIVGVPPFCDQRLDRPIHSRHELPERTPTRQPVRPEQYWQQDRARIADSAHEVAELGAEQL